MATTSGGITLSGDAPPTPEASKSITLLKASPSGKEGSVDQEGFYFQDEPKLGLTMSQLQALKVICNIVEPAREILQSGLMNLDKTRCDSGHPVQTYWQYNQLPHLALGGGIDNCLKDQNPDSSKSLASPNADDTDPGNQKAQTENLNSTMAPPNNDQTKDTEYCH